jgi:hypothetical protein
MMYAYFPLELTFVPFSPPMIIVLMDAAPKPGPDEEVPAPWFYMSAN